MRLSLIPTGTPVDDNNGKLRGGTGGCLSGVTSKYAGHFLIVYVPRFCLFGWCLRVYRRYWVPENEFTVLNNTSGREFVRIHHSWRYAETFMEEPRPTEEG